MEHLNLDQIRLFADMLSQPAFAVKDGLVCYSNSAFAKFQIGIGTPLQSFFGTQVQIPVDNVETFDCTVAGLPCTAITFRMQGALLYLLRLHEQTISVHALSHTTKSLRISLHSMYSAMVALCEKIEQTEDEKSLQQSASILQEIYRVEHTVQNLELLQKLLCGSYLLKPEKTDIVNFLSDLFSHAEALLRYANIQLKTELPSKLFNGNLDHTLVHAVIWNAIANAAAFSKDKSVFVRAQHRDGQLQLTFTNSGVLSAASQNRLFSRYLVPIDESFSDTGSGFGLSVIRQAVMLHGGTMLFATKPDQVVAFTLTFDLTKYREVTVSNTLPVLHGLDLGLVHLSSVLPRSAYDSRDIV